MSQVYTNDAPTPAFTKLEPAFPFLQIPQLHLAQPKLSRVDFFAPITSSNVIASATVNTDPVAHDLPLLPAMKLTHL